MTHIPLIESLHHHHGSMIAGIPMMLKRDHRECITIEVVSFPQVP